MVLTRRFLILTLALSAVVLLLPSPATVWLCLAGLVLAATVDLVLAGSPRRVRIERVPTGPVRLGERTSASTRLVNTGRRGLRGSAKDGWQPSAQAEETVHGLRLRPGGSQLIGTGLRPRRRGDLRSRYVAVRSLGPLGLAGRQVTHRVTHTQQVMPPFRSRRHLPSKLQRLRELDGQTAVQLRGAGTEFDSLRDYVRGDDVRSIDWRATARRQHLVVRTWRPERDRRVIICLDSSRTSAARIGSHDIESAGHAESDGAGPVVADEPRLDTGMEASLLLGVLAASAGDRVDFFGFDRQVVGRASSAATPSGRDLLGQMVSTMARMRPELVEADFSRLPAHVAQVSSQRSLVVLLTSLDSASLEEGLLPVLPALTAKHLVVLAAVRDPELDRRTAARGTPGEVYRAAAAERALIEKDALRSQLAALGVEVVEGSPEELPPVLADTYIRLKATGRL